jgi:hypothetical protein
MLHRLETDDHRDRGEALRILLGRYIAHGHSNAPVHEWPLN